MKYCLGFLISLSLIISPAFLMADNPDSLNILEKTSHSRLGLAAINTANQETVLFNANQRFPICSTFKFMLVAAVLKQSMTDPNLLKQKITYQKKDFAGYSPITQKYLSEGLTIEALCEAAIMYSDNTAGNLLMRKLGGPQAITVFARSIGDSNFRLDRWEPELNTAIPGDPRDTDTPKNMALDLEKILLTDQVLGVTQKNLLITWLQNCKTGDHRIRAGVPKNWTVGDKTGTGDYGTTNDIGILWPPHQKPIVMVIYLTHDNADAQPNEAAIAEATQESLKRLGNN